MQVECRELHVRFYAGAPPADAGGHALGTLCELDREPRRLRAREIKALQEPAASAVEALRRRTRRSRPAVLLDDGDDGIADRAQHRVGLERLDDEAVHAGRDRGLDGGRVERA